MKKTNPSTFWKEGKTKPFIKLNLFPKRSRTKTNLISIKPFERKIKPAPNKKLTYPQAIKKYPSLNPLGDYDGDNVMNAFDCKPFDKKKHMAFKRDDGGRCKAGFKGKAPDCFLRAYSITEEKDYKEAYNELEEKFSKMKPLKGKSVRGSGVSHPNTGVYREHADQILKDKGYKWIPTSGIGKGFEMHVKEGELPAGKNILRVSKHYIASEDDDWKDTHDSSRNQRRGVYGYWRKGQNEQPNVQSVSGNKSLYKSKNIETPEVLKEKYGDMTKKEIESQEQGIIEREKIIKRREGKHIYRHGTNPYAIEKLKKGEDGKMILLGGLFSETNPNPEKNAINFARAEAGSPGSKGKGAVITIYSDNPDLGKSSGQTDISKEHIVIKHYQFNPQEIYEARDWGPAAGPRDWMETPDVTKEEIIDTTITDDVSPTSTEDTDDYGYDYDTSSQKLIDDSTDVDEIDDVEETDDEE